MPRPSYVAYVDEAGDEGFRFDRGSSAWFVVSAVLIRKPLDVETVKLVDNVRRVLGKPPKKPLHFRDLRHEQKLPYIAEIARAAVETVSVMIHKPSLPELDNHREKRRLYVRAVRLLLEQVSWLCHDRRMPDDGTDGSAEITFSNKAGMSHEKLRGYLELLRKQSELQDVTIDWDVVRTEQMRAYTPGKRMGLQIADAVASGVFAALQPSQYGFSEDRYVRMLKPVTYHHQGRYLGYGLKFWPREVETHLEGDESLNWIREHQ